MACNPVSTYRIQLNKEFSFEELEKIIPYLQELGIKTIYASPVFKSVPGSAHGYDCTHPLEINPEIGTINQLKEIAMQLAEKNMGWLQDIVPNHLAFHSANTWLMDVLEKGKESAYADFFDIDWNHTIFRGKVMVPFLSSSAEEAIEKGELKIVWQGEKYFLQHGDSLFPLNAASLKQEMFTDESSSSDSLIQKINTDRTLLKKIVEKQHYHLCHWQEADQHINYRRFFIVNGLICIQQNNEKVFDVFHQLIKTCIDEKIFNGLRVDHIDGLYDPGEYLQKLREFCGASTYITVEKILQPAEKLPDWPVQGNTGYDFLSLVNNLFTNKKNEEAFRNFYEDISGNYSSAEEEVWEKKYLILHKHMNGELENLFSLLIGFIDKRYLSSIHPEELKEMIGDFLIHCPVYRNYGIQIPFTDTEKNSIENILRTIERNGKVRSEVVQVFRKILFAGNEKDEEYKNKLLHFYKRCMQFTGPLMAKGVEDTLMYTRNFFIAHNEVGDFPDAFGITPQQFHSIMAERQQRWSLSMNATSTHDTKRGEDVRARLNVLSDIPEEWINTVNSWKKLNQSLKQKNIPSENEEYFIYQTLIGAYPMEEDDKTEFSERIKAYLVKALREGKINSNWENPNIKYEAAVKNFAEQLITAKNEFSKSFHSLLNKIIDFGIVNSLSQLILKFSCPGVPDIYQGCELWDLSLVDPDNRRSIDYSYRKKLLDEIENETGHENFLKKIWDERRNGKIKLWLTQLLLELRKQDPDFFANAEYIPVEVEGEYSEYVFAFARKHREKWIIIALPLHLAALCKIQNKDIFPVDWKDTRLVLPKELQGPSENIVAKETTEIKNELPVQDLFSSLPFSILKIQTEKNKRRAGILLHITSLPSKFGMGDLGPEVYLFAEMLSRCEQRIWQLLPLNPVDASQGFSPYSSVSAMAGNDLLISAELLAHDKLIPEKELEKYKLPITDRVNFNEVISMRKQLFSEVWKKASEHFGNQMWKQFIQFTESENDWLHDFALYSVIKSQNENKPWFQWADEWKKRDEKALKKVESENAEQLNEIKFFQFIFFRQWKALKAFCGERNIELLGDLPMYVSHDSVETWSHPEIFKIDKEGKLMGIAGTPPDAFSADGQYWGMPVFNWEVLKNENYKWWINRLRKNLELFDLVRLDHFRAFAAFWEIPASGGSAKSGHWQSGPGADFFENVKNQLGKLPFVAEDLGHIDEPVINLKDQFGLPGMKVLQFAFEESMPLSDHIPHNYKSNFFVYTGTHDNNTTRGWYNQNLDDAGKKRIEIYTGREITEEEVSPVLIRMAYSSVANTVVIPMQDILNLSEGARMNIPSTGDNNWSWRLIPGQLNEKTESFLKELVWLYNRK